MSIKVELKHPEYLSIDLQTSVSKILEENTLLSMATIKEENQSYINTAFFCYNKHLEFYILTDPKSQHCQNLISNKSVALTICDSHQKWTDDVKGLQLLGECKLAKGKKLIEGTILYLKRFTGLSDLIKHPDDFAKGIIKTKLYVIKTNWLQLYDTARFGDDNFIPISY